MALLVGCIPVCLASVDLSFTSGFMNGGVVPDGNTTGWFNTQTLSGYSGEAISEISVSLNIQGGYTGDLYAFLSYGDSSIVLLNRLGRTSTDRNGDFGYSDPGLNVILSSSAAYDVHFYQQGGPSFDGGRLIGAWQPDGRNIDPLALSASFDSATRLDMLSKFLGRDPNGTWTLFVADMATGGGSPTVLSWGLKLNSPESVVPEPSTILTAVFCLIVCAGSACRARFKASR